jgi:hypothetical protein
VSNDYETIRKKLANYVKNHEKEESIRKSAKKNSRKQGKSVPKASLEEKTNRDKTFSRGKRLLERELVKANEMANLVVSWTKEEEEEFEELSNDEEEYVFKAAKWTKDLERILREMLQDEFVKSTIQEEPICGTDYFLTAAKKIKDAIQVLTPEKMKIYYRTA